MSKPPPSEAPKPPPLAIIPVIPLPDTLCVPPPPPTTVQSAKRARTADEEVRHAHTTTTANTTRNISSFAETVISDALAKAEVYRSIATVLDSELARISVVSSSESESGEE
ncbi:hypothetical protein SMAC4_13193 [Sordaria macrospora]|uniref:uncharacterized protein n=1 Tax=Sordaria macrospora TaxID=5147 RepID=UPI002B2C8C21|nr:hypothetical protein SMAC4_13193 [Sordaria macrospora]